MENKTPAWKRNNSDSYDRQTRLGPIEVEVRNGDIDQALRELKNKLSKDGILAELKARRCYEKPSEKKRRKHREALKQMRKSRGRKARVARQER
jgi:small subunit ribosomal protein S21